MKLVTREYSQCPQFLQRRRLYPIPDCSYTFYLQEYKSREIHFQVYSSTFRSEMRHFLTLLRAISIMLLLIARHHISHTCLVISLLVLTCDWRGDPNPKFHAFCFLSTLQFPCISTNCTVSLLIIYLTFLTLVLYLSQHLSVTKPRSTTRSFLHSHVYNPFCFFTENVFALPAITTIFSVVL